MKKKLLSGVFTVCMLIFMLPGAAKAETGEEKKVEMVIEEELEVDEIKEETTEEVEKEETTEGKTIEEAEKEETTEGKTIEEAEKEETTEEKTAETEPEEGAAVQAEAAENERVEQRVGGYQMIPFEVSLVDIEVAEEGEVKAFRSTAIPSVYDNRANLPAVRQQGGYGTCWSFAAMIAAESGMISQGEIINGSKVDRSIDLSEYQLAYFQYFSVDDPLGNTTGDKTIGRRLVDAENNKYEDLDGSEALSKGYLNIGGNNMLATWSMAAWRAGAAETTAPYDSIASTNGILDRSIAFDYNEVHLQNAYWISIEQPNLVKQMIMDYGAVAVSYMEHGSAYNDSTSAYYSGKTYAEALSAGFYGHAVAIVGWNDNYSRTNFKAGCQPSSNGAWLVRNSWGDSYGDAGYFWMSYEEGTLEDAVIALEFEDADNYEYNYQYDGGCGVSSVQVENGCVANVFQVKGNETQLLEAVAIGLKSTNVKYSLQIYKNPTDGNPCSGTPMLPIAQTGTIIYSGYQTIELNMPVELKLGDTFSVVFTFEGNVKVFVDANANYGWVRTVSATQPNQSFLIDASGHFDLNNSHVAARIKAFTNIRAAGDSTSIAVAAPGQNGSVTYYKNGAVESTVLIAAPEKMLLSDTELSYNGAVNYPKSVCVYDKNGNKIDSGHYSVTYSNPNSTVPGTYTVTVTFGGNYYTGSLTSNYKITINPVSKIKNSGSTTSSIDLSWDANGNADGYELYAAASKTGTYAKLATLEGYASCSYTHQNLSSGKSYYYKVRAYNKIAGKAYYSTYSDILCSTTKPAKVSNLKAASQSTGTIKLSWKAVSRASGYQIYWYDSSAKSWKKLATLDGSTTSYTDKNRKAGTTYKYRVRAYCKNGSDVVYGSYSSTLSASTKPAQVQSLKAGSNGTTSIKITWKKVTGASGYQVYRYDSSAKKWKKLATVGSSKNYYTNKELKSGTTYKYKVRAYRKDGDTTLYGSYSTVLTTAAKPAKVKSVKASSVKKTSLKLSWKKVTGASGYQIYQYKASKKKYVKIATVTKGSTVAKKLTSLKAKTTYKYKVRAYKKVNGKTIYGSYSDVIKVTTKK